jgi:sugar phosphate isomerase/epimerase
MKFGAPTWPFQWNPPYQQALRRIAAAGFRATEIVSWNLDVINDYFTPANLTDLKSILDGEGLELSQFCTHPRGLSSADAGIRAANIEHWKRASEIGRTLGTGIINMVSHHPFGMTDGNEVPRIRTRPVQQLFTLQTPEGMDWQQNYEDYVDAVRLCAIACSDAGLEMTIEPHPFRYVANNASALRLIEKVDHPALGINFDPSHTFPCGEFPNVSIYQLAGHVKHCHASDNDGTTNVHWRPGKGKIDWVAMFRALKDTGYDGVVSIELEDVPGVAQPSGNARGEPERKTATEEFMAETVGGAEYLKAICRDLNIPVE